MHTSSNFIAQARQGKNNPWRVILGILVPVFSFGAFLVTFNFLLKPWIESNEAFRDSEFIRLCLGSVMTGLGFLFLLLGTLFSVRVIHRRSLRSVWQAGRMRKRSIVEGIVVWGILLFLGDLILEVGFVDFVASAEISIVLLWAGLASAVSILIQGTTEEVLFRGYLLQLMHLRIKNVWLLFAINSIIFGVGHMGSGFDALVATTIFGFFFCLIVQREQNLGFASGLHFVNNFYVIFLLRGFLERGPEEGAYWEFDWVAVGSLVVMGVLTLAYLKLRNHLGRPRVATPTVATPTMAEPELMAVPS